MSNIAVVTDTAKEIARQTVFDFASGVFAHVNGDWNGHSQIRVLTEVYTDTHSDRAVNTVGQKSVQCRLLSSIDQDSASVDVSVVIPVMVASGSVSPLVGQAPLILRQPQNQQVALGTPMAMSVFAISSSPLTYQWQKAPTSSGDFVSLARQVQSGISFNQTALTQGGRYRVVVQNSNGSVVSNSATLTVLPNPSGVGGDSGGGIPSWFQPFHDFF